MNDKQSHGEALPMYSGQDIWSSVFQSIREEMPKYREEKPGDVIRVEMSAHVLEGLDNIESSWANKTPQEIGVEIAAILKSLPTSAKQ